MTTRNRAGGASPQPTTCEGYFVDTFDRVIGTIDGLPGVRKSRPSTIVAVTALLGASQTFVVQTYSTEDGNYGFVQMVDADGGQRIVLPPKVMAAIYAQRESVIRKGRKERARDWQARIRAEALRRMEEEGLSSGVSGDPAAG